MVVEHVRQVVEGLIRAEVDPYQLLNEAIPINSTILVSNTLTCESANQDSAAVKLTLAVAWPMSRRQVDSRRLAPR